MTYGEVLHSKSIHRRIICFTPLSFKTGGYKTACSTTDPGAAFLFVRLYMTQTPLV